MSKILIAQSAVISLLANQVGELLQKETAGVNSATIVEQQKAVIDKLNEISGTPIDDNTDIIGAGEGETYTPDSNSGEDQIVS